MINLCTAMRNGSLVCFHERTSCIMACVLYVCVVLDAVYVRLGIIFMYAQLLKQLHSYMYVF